MYHVPQCMAAPQTSAMPSAEGDSPGVQTQLRSPVPQLPRVNFQSPRAPLKSPNAVVVYFFPRISKGKRGQVTGLRTHSTGQRSGRLPRWTGGQLEGSRQQGRPLPMTHSCPEGRGHPGTRRRWTRGPSPLPAASNHRPRPPTSVRPGEISMAGVFPESQQDIRLPDTGQTGTDRGTTASREAGDREEGAAGQRRDRERGQGQGPASILGDRSAHHAGGGSCAGLGRSGGRPPARPKV